jgi:hypothetical protein
MTFEQLQYGDVFIIDGAYFQVFRKHGRIVGALLLTEDMQHVPAPGDCCGFGLASTVYSDLRVNRNNATPAECSAYLETLSAANQKHE